MDQQIDGQTLRETDRSTDDIAISLSCVAFMSDADTGLWAGQYKDGSARNRL